MLAQREGGYRLPHRGTHLESCRVTFTVELVQREEERADLLRVVDSVDDHPKGQVHRGERQAEQHGHVQVRCSGQDTQGDRQAHLDRNRTVRGALFCSLRVVDNVSRQQ